MVSDAYYNKVHDAFTSLHGTFKLLQNHPLMREKAPTPETLASFEELLGRAHGVTEEEKVVAATVSYLAHLGTGPFLGFILNLKRPHIALYSHATALKAALCADRAEPPFDLYVTDRGNFRVRHHNALTPSRNSRRSSGAASPASLSRAEISVPQPAAVANGRPATAGTRGGAGTRLARQNASEMLAGLNAPDVEEEAPESPALMPQVGRPLLEKPSYRDVAASPASPMSPASPAVSRSKPMAKSWADVNDDDDDEATAALFSNISANFPGSIAAAKTTTEPAPAATNGAAAEPVAAIAEPVANGAAAEFDADERDTDADEKEKAEPDAAAEKDVEESPDVEEPAPEAKAPTKAADVKKAADAKKATDVKPSAKAADAKAPAKTTDVKAAEVKAPAKAAEAKPPAKASVAAKKSPPAKKAAAKKAAAAKKKAPAPAPAKKAVAAPAAGAKALADASEED